MIQPMRLAEVDGQLLRVRKLYHNAGIPVY
jgi:hypothetical protein